MTDHGQDPRLIASLEEEARGRPRIYRMRLALLALAGDFTLTAVQVAPWFVIVFFGVVLANRVFFYWLGAAALLFFIWMVRPSFRIQGRELRQEEAPELFAALHAVQGKLRVPGRMEVLLDAELNASAAETRGLFGVLGTRRVLTLGVPLLATLIREELMAVIAHEYGHFSRRHGRLGHWLYRARVGWLRYAEHVDESDSTFYRAAAWYAARFVPYFSARSFVHSRQCEYEADADGASVAGSEAFASALVRIALTARFWSRGLGRELRVWQAASPAAPPDFLARTTEAARLAVSSEPPSALDEVLKEHAGWSDTHPTLSARLAALKQEARLLPGGVSAGESLFGAAWPGIVAEFDATWSREMRVLWSFEHYRLKYSEGEVFDADETTARSWPPDKQLARARALRSVEPEEGLKVLRALHERSAGDPRIAFAYAAALLNENDAAGVSIIEGVARQNPLFRMPACVRLRRYFERRGDRTQTERYSEAERLAARRENAAVEALLPLLEDGKAGASLLPPEITRVLRDTVATDESVKTAWIFDGVAQLEISADGRSVPLAVHTLVLAIDPEAMRQCEQDESTILERYRLALTSLLHPDECGAVRTYFTTENMPAGLGGRADALLFDRG